MAFYVEVAAFLSPAIMVAGLACLQNMEWYRKKGYSSIGDLFKRNSTDRIEETWLVNKEVGAIELAEALQGFTSKEVIPMEIASSLSLIIWTESVQTK